MGSVVSRKRGDRTYTYYVYYDSEGRRIESYCGAETDPESRRKLLQAEVAESEMQIAGLDARLAGLRAELDKMGDGADGAAAQSAS